MNNQPPIEQPHVCNKYVDQACEKFKDCCDRGHCRYDVLQILENISKDCEYGCGTRNRQRAKDAIALIRQHSAEPSVLELLKGEIDNHESLMIHVVKCHDCRVALYERNNLCQEHLRLCGAGSERLFKAKAVIAIMEAASASDGTSEIADTDIKQIADYIWRKIQPGESGVSRDTIAREIRNALGDASTRKDEKNTVLKDDNGASTTSPAKDTLTTGSPQTVTANLEPESTGDAGGRTSVGRSCEIPLDINKLADDITRIIRLQNGKGFCPGTTSNELGLEVIQEIYPYLRTTEPVPSSESRLIEFVRNGKYAYFDIVDGKGVFGGDIEVDEAASLFIERVNELLPYTIKPVSVSLEKCSIALKERMSQGPNGCLNEAKLARAVLDAAGVKYVD